MSLTSSIPRAKYVVQALPKPRHSATPILGHTCGQQPRALLPFASLSLASFMALKTEFNVTQTASENEFEAVPTKVVTTVSKLIDDTIDVKLGYGTQFPELSMFR